MVCMEADIHTADETIIDSTFLNLAGENKSNSLWQCTFLSIDLFPRTELCTCKTGYKKFSIGSRIGHSKRGKGRSLCKNRWGGGLKCNSTFNHHLKWHYRKQKVHKYMTTRIWMPVLPTVRDGVSLVFFTAVFWWFRAEAGIVFVDLIMKSMDIYVIKVIDTMLVLEIFNQSLAVFIGEWLCLLSPYRSLYITNMFPCWYS